jgi:hypothetical protein
LVAGVAGGGGPVRAAGVVVLVPGMTCVLPCAARWGGGGVWVVGWWWVEICIVDASICCLLCSSWCVVMW